MSSPNVHYAPQTLQRINAYHADLKDRVQEGHITADEARTLLLDFVQNEAENGALFSHLKVKCPQCRAKNLVIGEVQKFRCKCSPDTERSAWDYRVER